MTFPLFPRLLALGLFVLTSGVLHAASKDSDAFPKTARASSPARLLDPDLFPDNDFAQKPGPVFVVNPPQEEEDLDQDPLLLELMRERDAALKRAKDAEKKVASKTLLIELMREKEAAEKKAKEAEAIAAEQDRQIAEMKKQPVKPQPVPVAPIPRPFTDGIVIPEVARGYEDIYRRFLGGKLIYTDPSSKAKKELPIRALANPLEGTFDLSGCGDTGQYLSISTGYRKAQKAENASKVEIWLAPRFLVNKNLSASAKHLQPIMGSWDAAAAPVGLFWTWGGWGNADYDYLVSESLDLLGSEDLWEKAKKAVSSCAARVAVIQVSFLN